METHQRLDSYLHRLLDGPDAAHAARSRCARISVVRRSAPARVLSEVKRSGKRAGGLVERTGQATAAASSRPTGVAEQGATTRQVEMLKINHRARPPSLSSGPSEFRRSAGANFPSMAATLGGLDGGCRESPCGPPLQPRSIAGER